MLERKEIVGFKAGIKREEQSPARRIFWTEGGEGDVTLVSAVGADMWTPHVSD